MKTAKTPEQIKNELRQQGVTIKQLARNLGFDDKIITKLLNGQLKGNYGVAHDAAKAIGLK